MKINIQYQIELKDLPEVVADLLDKTYLALSNNCDTLNKFSTRLKNAENPSQIISEIGLFRELLSKEDKRLDDIMCMLAQYQQTESEIFFAEREQVEASLKAKTSITNNSENEKNIENNPIEMTK